MEIKIQSIHFDATEKLEAFIEKKVAKLEKSYEDMAVPGNTLRVEKVSDTFEESIDLCVDSMRAQLQKFKEKLRNY